jgi:hypothetical protein
MQEGAGGILGVNSGIIEETSHPGCEAALGM